MTHTNGTTWQNREAEARIETLERRLEGRPLFRMPPLVRNGGFHPLPLAALTPEQARAFAWQLWTVANDLHNVLAERGHIDDAVILSVWGRLRSLARRASKWQPAAGSDSPHASGGSSAQAGEGEIHRSAGLNSPIEVTAPRPA